MTTLADAPRTRKPRPKPERTVRWADVPAGGIVIRVGQVEDRYAVTELECPIGRHFHLTKLGPRGGDGHEHDVLLAHDGHQCSCPGHAYRGTCLHVEALTALLGRPVPPARPATTRPDPADLDHF